MFRAYCHKCNTGADHEEISSIEGHALPVGPSTDRKYTKVLEARHVVAMCTCGEVGFFVLPSRDKEAEMLQGDTG